MLNTWPGLSAGAEKIAEELKNKNVSKTLFKKTVKRLCSTESERRLKLDIQGYKKLGTLRDEVVKGNQYMFKETLQNSRSIYRLRVDMFEAKKNYKNKKEYKDEKYLCDSCETASDDNTHALYYCPAYSDLRAGKDLQNDADLALYLQKVVHIRAKLRLSR